MIKFFFIGSKRMLNTDMGTKLGHGRSLQIHLSTNQPKEDIVCWSMTVL